jgi:hypothetical protein
MRTDLEFRSSAFPPYPDEESQINPGLYGKRLAAFVVQALSGAGFEPDEPNPEDWGWCVTIKNPDFRLWVGCGHYQEYDDGFLCFIEPRKPFVRRWFRKVSAEATVSRVAEVLEKSLQQHPGVRDLRWWTEKESARGGA